MYEQGIKRKGMGIKMDAQDEKIIKSVGTALNALTDEEKKTFSAFLSGMAMVAKMRKPEAEEKKVG